MSALVSHFGSGQVRPNHQSLCVPARTKPHCRRSPMQVSPRRRLRSLLLVESLEDRWLLSAPALPGASRAVVAPPEQMVPEPALSRPIAPTPDTGNPPVQDASTSQLSPSGQASPPADTTTGSLGTVRTVTVSSGQAPQSSDTTTPSPLTRSDRTDKTSGTNNTGTSAGQKPLLTSVTAAKPVREATP